MLSLFSVEFKMEKRPENFSATSFHPKYLSASLYFSNGFDLLALSVLAKTPHNYFYRIKPCL